MGMAATQARFLSLTARKSNVEFQGQQINQQRTTLSNESANYYSELCNMVVPVPPSIDNYTKISYTFNDGAMNNTITSILANPKAGQANQPQYLVSYVQQWQDDYAPVEAASSFVNLASNGGFFVGNTQLRELASNIIASNKIKIAGQEYDVFNDEEGPYINRSVDVPCSDDEIANLKYGIFDFNGGPFVALNRNDDGTFSDSDGNIVDVNNLEDGRLFAPYLGDENSSDDEIIIVREEDGIFYKRNADTEQYHLSAEEQESLITTYEIAPEEISREEAYLYLLNEKYNGGDQSGKWYVRYVTDTQTGAQKPYFYKASDLLNANNYTTEKYASVNCYTIGSTTRTREVVNAPGTIERDTSGRYVSITLYGTDDDGEITTDLSKSITYTLTTNTSTDEAAYNNALNEYNYQQAQYDKKVQDINSKLEIVQQQDKSLELNLKQLDTEEQALVQEMEAVQKVISKNVSDSFGTFKATG